MCWDLRKKRNLASVQASFLTETNLNVIENKSMHRNCKSDSYLHCRLFAPLQQCERSWSMVQLFLHFHEGPIYWHGAQKYLYECRICLSEQWNVSTVWLLGTVLWLIWGIWLDCWGENWGLDNGWVRGSIMKCEMPHQWVICVNQVGFGIGWKRSGLSSPGKSKWSLGCVIGQMISSQLAAFDSPTLVWCCSSHWAT